MFHRLHPPSFCKLVQLTHFPNFVFVEMKKTVLFLFILFYFSVKTYMSSYFFFLTYSHCSEQVIRKIVQNMYLYFNNIVFQHSCSHTSMGDIMHVSSFGAYLPLRCGGWLLVSYLNFCSLPKERSYTFVWQLLCSSLFQCFLLP